MNKLFSDAEFDVWLKTDEGIITFSVLGRVVNATATWYSLVNGARCAVVLVTQTPGGIVMAMSDWAVIEDRHEPLARAVSSLKSRIVSAGQHH